MKHAQTLPPTDPNAKPVARDNKTKHTRPVMETYTLEELTFEKFLFSEMSKFSAEIKRTEKKVFATKVFDPQMHLYTYLSRNISLRSRFHIFHLLLSRKLWLNSRLFTKQ